MHCFISLKKCEKWCQMRVLLKKAEGNFIDLDVPLDTSAGRPINNKKGQGSRCSCDIIGEGEQHHLQAEDVCHEASRHSCGEGGRKGGSP
jgi:hypothetical protein